MNRTCPSAIIRHKQRAWTLVELLIAMALSLILISGISQIYLAAKHSYGVQTALAEIQDVGRYAVDTLTHDIHMAGYWGLMDIDVADSTPNDDPPPAASGDAFFLTGDIAPEGCLNGSDRKWGRMISWRIFGLNDTSSDVTANYNCIGRDRLRGDILTVRYADPGTVTGISDGRLYIRTAPFQGSLLAHGTAPLGNYVLDTLHSTHAVVAHAYYVAKTIDTNCGKVPVFARKFLNSNRTPQKQSLVNGVEHLQFQYGVDSDDDGSVNRYLNANAVTDWHQVRSVRFWVLVRASCPDNAHTDTEAYAMGDRVGNSAYKPHDHYHRMLYSATVALRN